MIFFVSFATLKGKLFWQLRAKEYQSYTSQQTPHKRLTGKDTRGWPPLLRREAV